MKEETFEELNEKAEIEYNSIVAEAIKDGDIEVNEDTRSLATKLIDSIFVQAMKDNANWKLDKTAKEQALIAEGKLEPKKIPVPLKSEELMRHKIRKTLQAYLQRAANERTPEDKDHQKVLFESVRIPKGYASCLCASGKQFKNCCKPMLKRQIRSKDNEVPA